MSDSTIKGTQTYLGGGDAEVKINATSNKALHVGPATPEYALTSRRGEGYTVGTATLFAPVAGYPGTTAALEVYNNGTRTMIVSELYAAMILGTAATQTFAIFAMVTTTKAVPTLTALSVFSNAGKAIVTPTAAGEIVTGVGTTVVANGWRPWGAVQAWGTAAALPGNAWSAPVNGKLIVPPRCSICVTVAGTLATASSFQAGLSFDWDDMVVDA